jgi:hypothetical protein
MIMFVDASNSFLKTLEFNLNTSLVGMVVGQYEMEIKV